MKDIILMGDEITTENINKSLISVKDAVADITSNIGLMQKDITDVQKAQAEAAVNNQPKPKPTVTLNVNILGNAATADQADQADKAANDALGNEIAATYFPKAGFKFNEETGELYIYNN